MGKQINSGILRDGKDVIEAASRGVVSPLYLFVGERPITAPVVRDLIAALVGAGGFDFNVEVILPEACSETGVFEAVRTRPFYPGRKVVLLQDPPFLTGVESGDSQGTGPIGWEEVFKWLSSRNDAGTVLIVESRSVDKKSPLFHVLGGLGSVTEMGISGVKSGRDARNAAALYVQGLLREVGKRPERGVVDLVLDRAGNDLVALKGEAEKLISLAGEGDSIGIEDAMGSVTGQREEEIFRLTEAIGNLDEASALDITSRLLARDVHPLALFQAITNFLRKMALIKAALQERSGALPVHGLSYAAFQKDILPELKAFWGEPAPDILKGAHPYGLYLMCKQSPGFNLEKILGLFTRLPEIDLALKGGQAAPQRIVLERLIFEITDRYN